MPLDCRPSPPPWRTVLVLASAALLAACATPADPVLPYQAPTAGPTARLMTRAIVTPGTAYVVSVLADGEHCRKPQLIGSGNAVQHPPSTTLAAGSPVTLEFEVFLPKQQFCRMRWTFTPAAGSAYLLAGASVFNACSALIDDVTDVDHVKREASALRRNPTAVSRCLPIAQSKPVVVAAAASAASGADAVLNEGATSTDLQGLITP